MYKSPLSRKEAKSVHKELVKMYNNKFKMYADSHQSENHCSDMLANPGIDERGDSTYISWGSGGMLQKVFCNLRL